MIVRPWRKGDTERIDIQSAQGYVTSLVDVSVDLTPLSEKGLVWTAEVGDKVLGCWGAVPEWQNRCVVFSLLGADCGKHMAAIHKASLRFLTSIPFRRMEAHVDIGFDQGIRWMKMLGFELEAYKRAFRPDGADMLEFVRIN